MKSHIDGKVVILTGASSGIGRATALALAPHRVRLVAVARRGSLLERLRAEMGPQADVLCLGLDLTKPDDVRQMVQQTHDKFGHIDVLINNAGVGYFGSVEHTPPAVVREVFALNFDAVLQAVQNVLPIMRRQHSGHIINVGSVASKRGLPLSGIYCATKFALDGLTQSLRLEVKDSGIVVSMVFPTSTQTPFFENVRRGDVVGKFKPMGRVQSAEQVATAIVNCIRRPRLEVYPYWLSRAVVWINAVAPSVVDKVMVPYFTERIRAKTGQ